MKSLSIFVSTALFGLAMPACATVTFVRATVSTDVRGGIGSESFGPSDFATPSSLPVAPLTVSSDFSGTVGTASFAATGTATVSFIDATRGTMSFLAGAAALNRPGDPAVVARSISNTRYIFSVDRSSKLSIDYMLDIVGDSPAAYILLARLDFTGNSVATLFNVADARNPGAHDFQLDAGSYSIRFGNNVRNAFSYADPGRDMDSIAGSLGFTIAAVPEPGSWAMMIVGFGTIGVSLRTARRRGGARVVHA